MIVLLCMGQNLLRNNRLIEDQEMLTAYSHFYDFLGVKVTNIDYFLIDVLLLAFYPVCILLGVII